MLKFRTGDEAYRDLFGMPDSSCVKVIGFQDQILPKIDYAISLHAKTCPDEMKRLVSLHPFTEKRVPAKEVSLSAIPSHDWLRPQELGDTIIVYTYVKDEFGNGQTIYCNTSFTEVYLLDIAD